MKPGTYLLAVLLLTACGPAAGVTGELATRKVRVTATTGMIADIAANAGGDRVEVIGLMGPGVDPHLYKASAGDVQRLAQADVILYNGLHLEAKMGQVIEEMGKKTKTVAVTDGIDPVRIIQDSRFEKQSDPHVWFDVTLWMRATETVRDALVAVDAANASVYRANTERYLKELDATHRYVQAQAAKIPPEQRILVTAHDAFSYFGRAYGFQVRGLQGISTASEAGARDVQDLADLIASKRIPAVFVETSVPERNLRAVQAAVAARGFDVRIGGELFSDAMGSAGTPEGTYIGMVRHNIDTIVGAFDR